MHMSGLFNIETQRVVQYFERHRKIEERFRQFKRSWHIAKFPFPAPGIICLFYRPILLLTVMMQGAGCQEVEYQPCKEVNTCFVKDKKRVPELVYLPNHRSYERELVEKGRAWEILISFFERVQPYTRISTP